MKKIIYSIIFLLSFLIINTVSAYDVTKIKIPSDYNEGGTLNGNYLVYLNDISATSTEDEIKENGILFSSDVYSAKLVSGEGSDDNSVFNIDNSKPGAVKLMPKSNYSKKKSYSVRVEFTLAKKIISFGASGVETKFSTQYEYETPIVFEIEKPSDSIGPYIELKEIKDGKIKMVKKQSGDTYIVEENKYTEYGTKENLKDILAIKNIIKSCYDVEEDKEYGNSGVYTVPGDPESVVKAASDNTTLEIKYYCKDSSGNAGSATLVFKKGRKPDIEKPRIWFTNNSGTWNNRNDGVNRKKVNIYYNTRIREPGVTCFDDYDNEEKTIDISSEVVTPASIRSNWSGGKPGGVEKFTEKNPPVGAKYEVVYRCEDKAGLYSTIKREFHVISDEDYIAPVLSKKTGVPEIIKINQNTSFNCLDYVQCIDDDGTGTKTDITTTNTSCTVHKPSSEKISSVTKVTGKKVIKAVCKDNSKAGPNYATPVYLELKVRAVNGISSLDISRNTIMSGVPSGYIIGKFTSGGVLYSDVTYTLSGDDKDFFEISGNNLLSKKVFNYKKPEDTTEVPGYGDNVYDITVKAKTKSGASIEEDFKIRVLPPNMVTGSVSGADNRCKGWAWSSNVGWLSLNCSNTSGCSYYAGDGGVNYGVDYSDKTGSLLGHAWSPNVGWLKVDGGSIDLYSNKFYGESYFVNYKDTSGWEGGLKYEGGSYQVSRNQNTKVLSRCAWGGVAVGWMCFSSPSTGKSYYPSNPAKCSGIRMSFNSIDNGQGETGLSYSSKITENINKKRLAKFELKVSGAKECHAVNGTGTAKWQGKTFKADASGFVNSVIEIDDLLESTSFSVECTNGGDVETRNLFIMVKPPGPDFKLKVSETSVPLGSKVTLSWDIDHVSECRPRAIGGRNDSGWLSQTSSLFNIVGKKTSGKYKTNSLLTQGKYTFAIECRSAYPATYGYQFFYSNPVVVEVAGLSVDIKAIKNPVPFNHPVELRMYSNFAQKCTGEFVKPKTGAGSDTENYIEVGGFDKVWYDRAKDGGVSYENTQEFVSEPITVEGVYKFIYTCDPINNGTVVSGKSIPKSDEIEIRVTKVPTYIEV